MPQTTPPPGVSYDGRAETSRFWGRKSEKVRMCPHRLPHKDVIPEPGGRGLQCGLTPDRCMCVCLMCQAPMRARKRCGMQMPDGSICPWGDDRSEEDSSPEQSPEIPKGKRPRPWWRGAAPAPAPRPALAVEAPLPLPNLRASTTTALTRIVRRLEPSFPRWRTCGGSAQPVQELWLRVARRWHLWRT